MGILGSERERRRRDDAILADRTRLRPVIEGSGERWIA